MTSEEFMKASEAATDIPGKFFNWLHASVDKTCVFKTNVSITGMSIKDYAQHVVNESQKQKTQ